MLVLTCKLNPYLTKINPMKILSLHIINLILLMAIVFASGKPKNLQVLDFDSIRDVKKYMNTVAKDLGVKCSFCHDIRNKSKDTEHKIIARDMMKMQREINERLFLTESNSLKNNETQPQISCWTCHRGEKYPELLNHTK